MRSSCACSSCSQTDGKLFPHSDLGCTQLTQVGCVASQGGVATAGETDPADSAQENAAAPDEADAEVPQPELQHSPDDEKRLTRERERAVRGYLRECILIAV